MQRGLAPILIVILVVVLAVGGYFVYTNYSNNKPGLTEYEQASQANQQALQPSSTPAPSIDPAILRDRKRENEILKLFGAMEVNKDVDSSTYTALKAAQFGPAEIPTDPTPGNVFCFISPSSSATLTAWSKTCPTGWSPVSEGSLEGVKSWTFCAWLEKDVQYCKSNY